MTQQIDITDSIGRLVQHNERRVQVINYILALLLVIVLAWAAYAAWRSGLQAKITAIELVPGSVHVIGPTALCPGETLKIVYALDVGGVGVIVTDDSVKYRNHTVKFSDSRREYVERTQRNVYEDLWTIPPQPAMAIDGEFTWPSGEYTRYVSVAASNAYVSRYIDPASFAVGFTIRTNC